MRLQSAQYRRCAERASTVVEFTAALLLLAAAGAAIGLTETTSDAADNASPETLSLAGAIALIIVVGVVSAAKFYLLRDEKVRK